MEGVCRAIRRLQPTMVLFMSRSTEPVPATRVLPPQPIITLVARLRIDRRLETSAAVAKWAALSPPSRLAAPIVVHESSRTHR
jgi:hypothetical protein